MLNCKFNIKRSDFILLIENMFRKSNLSKLKERVYPSWISTFILRRILLFGKETVIRNILLRRILYFLQRINIEHLLLDVLKNDFIFL